MAGEAAQVEDDRIAQAHQLLDGGAPRRVEAEHLVDREAPFAVRPRAQQRLQPLGARRFGQEQLVQPPGEVHRALVEVDVERGEVGAADLVDRPDAAPALLDRVEHRVLTAALREHAQHQELRRRREGRVPAERHRVGERCQREPDQRQRGDRRGDVLALDRRRSRDPGERADAERDEARQRDVAEPAALAEPQQPGERTKADPQRRAASSRR
jgi:hypothetical protein